MRRLNGKVIFSLLTVLVFLFSITVVAAGTQGDRSGETNFLKGQILVKFKEGIPDTAKAKVHQALGATIKETISTIGTEVLLVPAGKESILLKTTPQGLRCCLPS